jgi:hypothetical protein
MIEDIAKILTWVLCGGIPLVVFLFQFFVLFRTLWVGFRKSKASS